MATKAGELFVEIGVKGADKTISAFTNVKQSIGDVASTSWEAKAAIVGALYALQQMASVSGTNAQGLVNLHNTLGIGIETLERYRGAVKLAGGTAAEMDASFSAIARSMAEFQRTGSAPASLWPISTAVHLDPTKIMNQDWVYMIQKLQEYAQRKDIALNQRMLSLQQMGLSQGTINAMMAGHFNAKTLGSIPVTSEQTAQGLTRMQQQFEKVGMAFAQMNDKFVIKWGPEIAKGITSLIGPLDHLVDSFMRLEKSMHAFELIGKVFQGWGSIFEGLSFSVDAITDPKKQQILKDNIGALGSGIYNSLKDFNPGNTNNPAINSKTTIQQNFYGPAQPHVVKRAAEEGVRNSQNRAVKNSQGAIRQ